MTDTLEGANIYSVVVRHQDEVPELQARFGATLRQNLLEAAKRGKGLVVSITTEEAFRLEVEDD